MSAKPLDPDGWRFTPRGENVAGLFLLLVLLVSAVAR